MNPETDRPDESEPTADQQPNPVTVTNILTNPDAESTNKIWSNILANGAIRQPVAPHIEDDDFNVPPLTLAREQVEATANQLQTARDEYARTKREAADAAGKTEAAKLDNDSGHLTTTEAAFAQSAYDKARVNEVYADQAMREAHDRAVAISDAHDRAVNEKDNAERAAAETERERVAPAAPSPDVPRSRNDNSGHGTMTTHDGGRMTGPDHTPDHFRNTAMLGGLENLRSGCHVVRPEDDSNLPVEVPSSKALDT